MSQEGSVKEQMIVKIKEIISNEKFKLDAYCFCGCPSGTPNQSLLKACEAYLAAVEQGLPGLEEAAVMLAEIESALVNKSKAADNLVNNDGDLQEVLDHKDVLLSA